MALVLPILLTLVLGIIEFGFYFNQQISVTQAAREGARAYAIHHAEPGFSLGSVVQGAAPTVPGIAGTASLAGCPVGSTVTVTTSVAYTSITGWPDFVMPATVQGKAGMRCGG